MKCRFGLLGVYFWGDGPRKSHWVRPEGREKGVAKTGKLASSESPHKISLSTKTTRPSTFLMMKN